MPRSALVEVQRQIAAALNALPGVFSTVQWGGRAYKLPGANGSRRKPRLLAHVCVTESGDRVSVDFKLPRPRAVELIERHDWLAPHSFRTLAPNGWVSARVRTKREATALVRLLKESHALHAPRAAAAPLPARSRRRAQPASAEALRLERVLRAKEAEGWRASAAQW